MTVPLPHKGALTCVCIGLLVIGIDNTVLNLGLPFIRQDLNATDTQLEWVIDSYLLAIAATLLPMGALGDRWGRSRLLIAGLAVFGLGSLLSVFATQPAQLIATRVLMGAAAGALMPMSVATIKVLYPDHGVRSRALAIWAAVMGAGVTVGPILAAVLLTATGSWRPLFGINVPIAVIAAIGVWKTVPPSADSDPKRFDVVGAVLVVVGMVALAYVIIEAPLARGLWKSPVLMVAAIAILVVTVFVAWERRTTAPILDLSLVANRQFVAAAGAIALVYSALVGGVLLLTNFLQIARGLSPLGVAVALLPMTASITALTLLSARLEDRLGIRGTVVLGLAAIIVGMVGLTARNSTSSPLLLETLLVTMGIGLGIFQAPCMNALLDSVPIAKSGIGSAMNDLAREISAALGAAVIGSTLFAVYSARVADAAKETPSFRRLAGRLVSGDPRQLAVEIPRIRELARAGGDQAWQERLLRTLVGAYESGFTAAFAIATVVVVVALVLVLAWMPSTIMPVPKYFPDPDPDPDLPSSR